MAIVQSNSPLFDAQVPVRRWTAADLAVLPEVRPTGQVNYELLRGRLVMMSPRGRRHGITQAKIVTILETQGSMAGHGITWVEVGVLLNRDADTALAPDVAFAGKALLPLKESKEGYVETIPDLVVEVRSKNDSTPYLDEKVGTYLQAGVRQVWVAEPKTRTIAIYRAGVESLLIEATGTITDQEFPVIPGLKLVLADIFPLD